MVDILPAAGWMAQLGRIRASHFQALVNDFLGNICIRGFLLGKTKLGVMMKPDLRQYSMMMMMILGDE